MRAQVGAESGRGEAHATLKALDGFPAGPDPAIDHDRLFKELLTLFFAEFLELFFPKLFALIEPGSIEFLTQEHFVNFPDGSEYLADMVAKVRFKDTQAFFLIHVENQSTAPPDFPRRFFRYYSAIFERHDLPVYPIVVYSHDAPKKAQPNVYKTDFPDGRVLRFHYRVVQLNRLPWRRFVKRHNPVASALMAKMNVAERDRPKVKAECLRLMLTLRLDPARKRMIASFVDTYLNLNPAEEKLFNRSLDSAEWPPAKKEEIVEIVTSWERRGIERGRLEGRIETLRSVLLDVLVSRFGPLAVAMGDRVAAITSADDLRRILHRALTAGSIQELGLE